MRRHLSLLLALALCLGLLAGCGSEPSVDYPELAAVDTSAMELESAENSSLKVSFPKADWVAEPNTDPLTIYYAATLDEELSVNINVQLGGDDTSISEAYKDALVEAIGEQSPFLHVNKAQVMRLGEDPVVYLENTVTIDDATIDFMIESGVWTEDWVTEQGGREAFLAIPDTDSITLYAPCGDQMLIYTGSYYSDDQKDAVLEAMTIMAQTAEILR